MKKILALARWIAYVILLCTDVFVAVSSMLNTGDNPLEHIVGAVIGGCLCILGIFLFLQGIRTKGVERFIYLSTWILSVIMIVSINWGSKLQSLKVQSANNQSSENTQTLTTNTTGKEIDLALQQKTELIIKLSKTSEWRPLDIKKINEDIVTVDLKIAELKKEKPREKKIVSSGVFANMGGVFGVDSYLTASWWWFIAFLTLQLISVIVAPKPKDDAPVKKKRRRKKAKPATVPKPEKPKEAEEPGLFEWEEIKPKPLDK